MITASFYFLSLLAIVSALMVIFLRTPVYNVILLVITFFCIACHYLLLGATFLAVSHVIVYAGAIMVLLLYTLMMLNLNKADEPNRIPRQMIFGIVVAGILGMILFGAISRIDNNQINITANGQIGGVKNLGKFMLKEYLLPFEAVSILLLAAMAGAVMLGKTKDPNQTIESK
ncbi:MAG: NADH-quinone oxidoreductase subunit J [Saprospiraceae bacterium]